MNVTALVFLIVSVAAVIVLPRKWAPIPLLASCCYMTTGQGIELGPISLPIFRLVLAAGVFRALWKREGVAGGVNAIDKLVVLWAAWMIFASFFHEDLPGAGPVYASGFVYNISLVYFLTRVWCRDLAELTAVLRIMAWLLVPVAVAMVAEHVLQTNVFSVFGGVPEGVYIRDGAIRALGPFAHPILAGTVGAVCFPLMIGIWRRHRLSAAVGCAACVLIVVASTSSGPLMSLLIGMGALVMWFYRPWVRLARWALIGAYVSAEILMTRPAYYLISKIDLTGSSTGWHRSRLIEMAFEHLHEWWLFGTDYTVHWMGIAVDEAGRHSDITNYYLWIGVIGGLPAMLLLVASIWRAFRWVGSSIAGASSELKEYQFLIWCLGAGLLAHACTSLSVSYTDQSMTFFWLNLGAISSVYSLVVLAQRTDGHTNDPAAAAARPPGRKNIPSPRPMPRPTPHAGRYYRSRS